MTTLKHEDTGALVAAAKLLLGALKVTEKVEDADSYVKVNGVYDADFVARVCSFQAAHNVTSDGVIGPETWAVIAGLLPTVSTSKNRLSGHTMALQLILGGNLTADGIYGARTKSAVAVFQDAKGLTADGVCGPRTWKSLLGISAITGTAVEEPATAGTFKQPVNYKQHDSRWGGKMYSNHNAKSQTMSNSGCGPTAMADIVATLVDSSVTPWTLAQKAMSWGDRTYSSGTAWSFFNHIQTAYKFRKMVQTKSLDALKACLNAGGYAVCSMGPGYWTNGGHFICCWKYDGTYIYCNDPSSPTKKRAERKRQKTGEFMKELKQFFCFYPEVGT